MMTGGFGRPASFSMSLGGEKEAKSRVYKRPLINAVAL